MSNKTLHLPSLHRPRGPTHPIPKIILWLPFFFLRTRNKTDTIDRLADSQHVADLRLIVATAFVLILTIAVISWYYAHQMYAVDWNIAHKTQQQQELKRMLDAGAIFLKLSAPSFAVFGALVTWAYQRGSNRLGVVDLFACEIDTICRVIAVIEMVKVLTGPDPAAAMPGHFRSQEDYFPILAANSPALQSLEAKVVVNITAYYTYMKTVRDKFRSVEDLQTDSAKTSLQVSLAYTLYLALESGRRAVDDLVEFEPTHTERTLVILLSELPLYQFLRSVYASSDSVFHERLKNRECAYSQLQEQLDVVMTRHRDACERLMKMKEEKKVPSYEEEQWASAMTLWPVVLSNLEQLFPQAETSPSATHTLKSNRVDL